MLSAHAFIDLLAGLVESLPHQKTLSERGLGFAWSTFPAQAKQELTPVLLAYACNQRILDPEPRQQLAIHVQLLTYLYPLEAGIPVVERGLRLDLEQRMQRPQSFHPLSTHLAHQPPALPPLPVVPRRESAAERQQRLIQLAAQTGVAA